MTHGTTQPIRRTTAGLVRRSDRCSSRYRDRANAPAGIGWGCRARSVAFRASHARSLSAPGRPSRREARAHSIDSSAAASFVLDARRLRCRVFATAGRSIDTSVRPIHANHRRRLSCVASADNARAIHLPAWRPCAARWLQTYLDSIRGPVLMNCAQFDALYGSIGGCWCAPDR